MSLQARLDAIKASFTAKLPEESRAIMARSAKELRESGILEGVRRPGEAAPEFVLRDSKGSAHSLTGLTEKGPIVLSFFRGSW